MLFQAVNLAGRIMNSRSKKPAPNRPASPGITAVPPKRRPPLVPARATHGLPGTAATQDTFAPLLRAARSNGLFSSLSDSDAETVFSFCLFSFVEQDVQLIAEGDHADYLLFIADGRVNVTCNSSDNQVLRVGTASIGAMLGESAISAIGPRSASVATASRCALGYLYHMDFKRLCVAHPETALRFVIMVLSVR